MTEQCRILSTSWCRNFRRVSWPPRLIKVQVWNEIFADETIREREFYKARNLPCPKDVPQDTKEADDMETKLQEAHQESDYHRMDEQVNLCLECSSASNLKNLKRRFIRCSSQATITQLKKFVAKKVLNGIEKYREIDILCNDELLGKDHTLKFVYVTRWRFKDPPLRLQYRPKLLDI